jgi:hypothetical protein
MAINPLDWQKGNIPAVQTGQVSNPLSGLGGFLGGVATNVGNWLGGAAKPAPIQAQNISTNPFNNTQASSPNPLSFASKGNIQPYSQPIQTPQVSVPNMGATPAYAATTPQVYAPQNNNQQTGPSSDTSYKGVPVDYSGDVASQMAAIDSSLNKPQKYTVDTGNTYGSNMLSGAANQQTLQDMLNQKSQDLTSGGSGLSPSDKLMQEIYNAKQYSPEETAALQNYADASAQINAKTLAMKQKTKALMEGGSITKEQAANNIAETERVANAELANLAVQQSSAALNLDVFGRVRANQLGAYQTLFDMQKGSLTLSPGQGLYSATGQQVAGAAGIAPQITTLAEQLYSQSLTTGNTMMNPQTGQPDFGAYLQQASQLTGLPLPAGTAQPSYGTQSGVVSQGQGTPAGVYGSQGYGDIGKIPSGLQKYVVQAPLSDQSSENLSFIQADKVPDALKQTMKSYAANAGIPFLDGDGTKAVYAAQQILNVVDAAKALSIRQLSKGTSGRVTNSMKAWANNFLQFNPDLSNFAQLADAASKATTALAGGQGSGFRMNMPIIEVAIGNLPKAGDSQEYALTKADALATQIINGLKPVFPGVSTSNYGQLLNSTGQTGATKTSGSNIIQTKVGAVDNSWFN